MHSRLQNEHWLKKAFTTIAEIYGKTYPEIMFMFMVMFMETLTDIAGPWS